MIDPQLHARPAFHTLAAGGASQRGMSRGWGGVDILASPWFWGAAGAFVYSGPKLSTCVFDSRKTGAPTAKCVVDAIFAMVIGPISAAALTGTVQGYTGLSGADHLPAVSACLGILANPLAPGVIEVMSGAVLTRLRKLTGGDDAK